MAPVSRAATAKVEPEGPSFTEITLDVVPEAPPTAPLRPQMPGMNLHRPKNG